LERTHYDSASELQARLRSGTIRILYAPGTDAYGIPLSLAARRQALLNAATRESASQRPIRKQASAGRFTVRAEAVSLTGHRFPAGFSRRNAPRIFNCLSPDTTDLYFYKSGYVVDNAASRDRRDSA